MGLPSVSLGNKFIQQAPEFLGRDKVSVLDVFSRHMTSLLWGGGCSSGNERAGSKPRTGIGIAR